jgi:hypothetical protein
MSRAPVRLNRLARFASLAALLATATAICGEPTQDRALRLAVAVAKGGRVAFQTDVTNRMTMSGVTMESVVHQFATMRAETVTEDGTVTLASRPDRVWGLLRTGVPGGEIQFDTDRHEAPKDSSLLAVLPALASPAGQTSRVRIARDGGVLGIDTGLVAGLEKCATAFDGLARLRSAAVAVGGTWEGANDFVLQGRRTRSKLTSTVTAIDAESVTLEHKGALAATGAVETADLPAPLEVKGSKELKAEFRVKTSSVRETVRISRADGLPLVADTEIAVTLSMAFGFKSDGAAAEDTWVEMTTRIHHERKPVPEEPAAASPSSK